MKTTTKPQAADPIAVSIYDAARRIGISRTRFYREVADGRIPLRKVGRRSVVAVADLDAWLAKLPRVPARAA